MILEAEEHLCAEHDYPALVESGLNLVPELGHLRPPDQP
jgi:hypothetical protein